jgi:hypothetical protein
MRREVLKRELRMNRQQAGVVLETVLGRSISTAPGRVSKIQLLSEHEEAVVTCIATQLKGGSQFNHHDLFEDFCRALQELLDATEKLALRKFRPAISLFALTILHNRQIDLGGGDCAKIRIMEDMYGNLGVFATAEVGKDYGSGSTEASIWIFETNLPVSQHCETGAAPSGRWPFVGDFELKPTCKLGRPT